jgi:tetraacyldisaccharide 4'-kinase
MKLATPRWWYRREGAPSPLTRALLTPLSWIWAAQTARRIARTQPRGADCAVICVGNFTVGGVGKTPIVRELLLTLTQRGRRAHGLSRGYGGKLKGPVRVDVARHTAKDVGDEPLMLAQDFPMWVSRDRVLGARKAAAAGAEVVVMDDGHQNPDLRKTLSLVVVDGETRDDEWPFGDGKVFPAGPMREPLAISLARTDAVIVLLPDDLPVGRSRTAGPVRRHAGADRPAGARRPAAQGPPGRLRRHRQALEGRAGPAGRRLPPGRLRALSGPWRL